MRIWTYIDEHDFNDISPESELAKRVHAMKLRQVSKEFSQYRAVARERAREGELEVDEDAVVSQGDNAGAYVQAWWWIERNLVK